MVVLAEGLLVSEEGIELSLNPRNVAEHLTASSFIALLRAAQPADFIRNIANELEITIQDDLKFLTEEQKKLITDRLVKEYLFSDTDKLEGPGAIVSTEYITLRAKPEGAITLVKDGKLRAYLDLNEVAGKTYARLGVAQRDGKTSVIEISDDGEDQVLTLTAGIRQDVVEGDYTVVVGNSENGGTLNILVANEVNLVVGKTEGAKINITCKGDIALAVDGDMTAEVGGQLNAIAAGDVNIGGNSVSVGFDPENAQEPVVLGNQLKATIDSLINAVQRLDAQKVTTVTGAAVGIATPVASADIVNAETAAENLTSENVFVD